MKFTQFFNKEMGLLSLVGIIMSVFFFLVILSDVEGRRKAARAENNLYLAVQNRLSTDERANWAGEAIRKIAETGITLDALRELQSLGYLHLFLEKGELLVEIALGKRTVEMKKIPGYKKLMWSFVGLCWLLISLMMTIARVYFPENEKHPLDLPWREWWLYPCLLLMFPVFPIYYVEVKATLFFKGNHITEVG